MNYGLFSVLDYLLFTLSFGCTGMRCCSGEGQLLQTEWSMMGRDLWRPGFLSLVGRLRDGSCVDRPIGVFTNTLGWSPIHWVTISVVLKKRIVFTLSYILGNLIILVFLCHF